MLCSRIGSRASPTVIRPTFYTRARPVVPDVRITSLSLSLSSRFPFPLPESAPGRAGRQDHFPLPESAPGRADVRIYTVQRRYRRSGAARNVASAKPVGRRTPWSSSSSRAATSRPAAACYAVLRPLLSASRARLLPRTGEGAVRHRGGGKVERVARVPQAASDLATVEKSWSRTAAGVSPTPMRDSRSHNGHLRAVANASSASAEHAATRALSFDRRARRSSRCRAGSAIAWSAYTALSALPSWRRSTTALIAVIRSSRTRVLHFLMRASCAATRAPRVRRRCSLHPAAQTAGHPRQDGSHRVAAKTSGIDKCQHHHGRLAGDQGVGRTRSHLEP